MKEKRRVKMISASKDNGHRLFLKGYPPFRKEKARGFFSLVDNLDHRTRKNPGKRRGGFGT